MFDDEDTIPLYHELIEDIEELLHIGEMETRRRLIENIEGLASRALREIIGELDTLRFSS